MNEFRIEVQAIACFAAFLLGSLTFSRWLSRDPSGKTTWKTALLVFFLDASKGALPVLIMSSHGLHDWLSTLSGSHYELTATALWSIGLASVLGHCYSPWLKFNGGKGGSTTFGLLAVLSPVAAITGILTFSLVFYEKRNRSLATLAALGLASVSHLIVEPLGAYCWIGAGILFLVVLRNEHHLDVLLERGEAHFE